MKYKTKIVDGVEVEFSADWIRDLESNVHFNWYWNQAKLLYDNCSRDQLILEIGVGSSLLSDLLKRRGWNILTLDIDEDKRPDFCESAVDFDFSSRDIETVLAFEVFEHMPYPTFKKVIVNIANSKVRTVFFSLPWSELAVASFYLKLPKLKPIEWTISIPRRNIVERSHFWEVYKIDRHIGNGKQQISMRTLKRLFADTGFTFEMHSKIGCIQYFSATKP